MFENLSSNLTRIFNKLTSKGYLTESEIELTMREIRIALLEADVNLTIVKDFINKVKISIIGKEVIKSISPAQMIIKLVEENLVEILGTENSELNLNIPAPIKIMMVGLQGSGKTTNSGKIGLRITQKYHKKVLLVSLDTIRFAAQEQLAALAQQASVDFLPIIADENPLEIASRALKLVNSKNYEVVIFDTAGRLHIDENLMNELKKLKDLINPQEILLVADATTGQDALNIANKFNDSLSITGTILTRIDGDTRGGAALSIKAITGCAIKFISTGEKLTEIEEFHPKRIVSRILDMGDIISLVERAAENVDIEEAQKLAKRAQKGNFDLNDLSLQLKNIRKMGGISGVINLLPGMKNIKNKINDVKSNEKIILKQEAIILSMTKHERRNPKILNASRKRRIAKGSGSTIQEVNKLLKQYYDMNTVMKKISKMNKSSIMKQGFKGLFS